MRSTATVLVTGASSGIGRATALDLVDHGFDVLAGVRTDGAAASLADESGGRIRPVRLDVTDPDTIEHAAEEVAEVSGGHLGALVNNAGIPSVGPLELVPLHRFREVLETNVIGQVAVTQAMLPMVRRTRGRVVFISSLSGRAAMPFLGPYAASKHAVEAVADSWRRELAAHGVRVSVVEPGNIATPIWDKGLDPALIEELGPEAGRLYGPGIDFALAMGRRSAQGAVPADRVAAVVRRALTSRRPRARYVVGIDAAVATRLARHTPRLLDRMVAAAMARDARKGSAH
ncbi:MAG TPA: SDR family oxidoreductase [Marmoricola sp.]|nr:SDR family oxidoreductase [Marmoricola sp.]